MAAQQVKISVTQLQLGMFVSDLDRPWVETPFPIQGFYVRNHQDIEALAAFCRYVYIDQPLAAQEHQPHEHGIKSSANKDKRVANVLKLPPVVVRNPQNYQTLTSLKKESVVAERLQRRVRDVIANLGEQLKALGPIDVTEVGKVAGDMVESVVRNPDALLWLTRMQSRSQYAYQHAVNASIWALVFGRHLGLERSVLKVLATGVLLSQVGKAKLPQELLDKQGMLNPEEYEQYKKFVDYGVEILSEDKQLSHQVVTLVEFHRERHNGSGFPKGVTGESIPLLAKIAGLVDHYQELIEPHDGVTPLTSQEAVSRFYESRNIEFQEDLVERFIQAIGVYPTGTLVELSSHEVGIVLANNPERKLLPKVMVVLDADKKPLKSGKVVDLMTAGERSPGAAKINIAGSLPVGAYDIDPTRFDVSGATSKWSWRHLAG